jgi:hypothetical protein
MLARRKSYILPYCQGTYPCGEVKFFVKYSLTGMCLKLPPVQTDCPLLGDIHTKCHQTECHDFSVHNHVEHSKL